MENVKEKRCPFRVYREKTHFKYSQAEATTEKFYDCMGEECAAYYKGGCMRLVPPAIMIGDSPLRMRTDLTDADIEKLREELKNAQIMQVPPVEVPPAPEFRYEKGIQPHGAEQFAKACAVCKNEKSDLCGECKMEKKSGFEPPF